jgi:hypothetical protein
MTSTNLQSKHQKPILMGLLAGCQAEQIVTSEFKILTFFITPLTDKVGPFQTALYERKRHVSDNIRS